MNFVPRGPINNIPTLVQVMAWRRPGDKPLSEPMMVRLPTHICVTRPQWVIRSQFGDFVTHTHFLYSYKLTFCECRLKHSSSLQWRLKAPPSQLFVRQFVQADNKVQNFTILSCKFTRPPSYIYIYIYCHKFTICRLQSKPIIVMTSHQRHRDSKLPPTLFKLTTKTAFLAFCERKPRGTDKSPSQRPAMRKAFPSHDIIILLKVRSSISPIGKLPLSWWRHQMETFSAFLAICAGNSPVPAEYPHKGQWRRALMFSLICVWINGWVNNREAGDLRRYRAHYDVIVILLICLFDPLNHIHIQQVSPPLSCADVC